MEPVSDSNSGLNVSNEPVDKHMPKGRKEKLAAERENDGEKIHTRRRGIVAVQQLGHVVDAATCTRNPTSRSQSFSYVCVCVCAESPGICTPVYVCVRVCVHSLVCAWAHGPRDILPNVVTLLIDADCA